MKHLVRLVFLCFPQICLQTLAQEVNDATVIFKQKLIKRTKWLEIIFLWYLYRIFKIRKKILCLLFIIMTIRLSFLPDMLFYTFLTQRTVLVHLYKAPSTHIWIFLNAHLFLSGYGFRLLASHESAYFKIRSTEWKITNLQWIR